MFSSFEIVLLVPRSPALRWLQGQLLELSGGYGDCIMLDFCGAIGHFVSFGQAVRYLSDFL